MQYEWDKNLEKYKIKLKYQEKKWAEENLGYRLVDDGFWFNPIWGVWLHEDVEKVKKVEENLQDFQGPKRGRPKSLEKKIEEVFEE